MPKGGVMGNLSGLGRLGVVEEKKLRILNSSVGPAVYRKPNSKDRAGRHIVDPYIRKRIHVGCDSVVMRKQGNCIGFIR